MRPDQPNLHAREPKDRIEGNRIILDGEGHYPKPVIICFKSGKVMEYRLFKTQFERFKLDR